MAAPTMQPVKNFAFIKCNSVIEYDLLPDYLKGADQFIFADIPSTRPDAQSGTSWHPSEDSNYKSSDGWTVNQFIEYVGEYIDSEWVDAKLYRFYWNTTTGNHAVKVMVGKAYSKIITADGLYYKHPPNSGRLFLVNAEWTYTSTGTVYINGVNLSSGEPGRYVAGRLRDSLVYLETARKGSEIYVISRGGYFSGLCITFLESDTEVNVGFRNGYGSPVLIPGS